jgi:hypothetical protein
MSHVDLDLQHIVLHCPEAILYWEICRVKGIHNQGTFFKLIQRFKSISILLEVISCEGSDPHTMPVSKREPTSTWQ